jgi:hypothetical protein
MITIRNVERINLANFTAAVYADASDACNQLNFQLGPTAIGTSIPTRQWNIKVILKSS